MTSIENTELSADEIKNKAAALPEDSSSVDFLISEMQNGGYLQGYNALWILKHCLNDWKIILSEEQTTQLIEFWAPSKIRLAHLLLLQCSDFLTLNEDSLVTWEEFVDASRKSTHKFVRANAYNGFIPIAKLQKDFIPELLQICEMEEVLAPPSGKARIKNISKELRYIAQA